MRVIAVGVSVDGDAVAEGEGEQRERAGDAVGDAVVGVASGGWWLVAVGSVWRTTSRGGRLDGFGEPDQVLQYVAEQVVVAEAAQGDAEAGQSADEVVLGVVRLLCVGRCGGEPRRVAGGSPWRSRRRRSSVPGRGPGVGGGEDEGEGGGAVEEAGVRRRC